MIDKCAKLQVLLVEDCRLTVQQFRDVIGSLPYSIDLSVAARESSAIAIAKLQSQDIVILDLNLKEGSGFNVLRVLRGLDHPPTIIVATNFALPQYRDFALLLGADYFIDKAKDLDLLPSLFGFIALKRRSASAANESTLLQPFNPQRSIRESRSHRNHN